ncbi:unnamed protein product [Angiostrongylus costaricensis]|uniref:Activated RNA polymerase II transcriptional coactivator p15 n=1 Tax=Angiostrongylus costaricensis TaxID=334426 RepID=A0A0R3PJC4_ANGCS|nr:unnamed protein product [Angiostrongylus costaricensis]
MAKLAKPEKWGYVMARRTSEDGSSKYPSKKMPRPGGSDGVKDKGKDKESTKKSHEKEKPMEKNEPKSQTEFVDSTSKKFIKGYVLHVTLSCTMFRKHSVRPTDELKLLQDSLTHFFTPSAGRRCRQPPRKFDESGVNSDDSVQPSTFWVLPFFFLFVKK